MLDRVLSHLAVAQAIFVTLRTGSKVLLPGWTPFPINNDTATATRSPILDLPPILPPTTTRNDDDDQTMESSFLYDLTMAFRQGVKLGLQLEEYETRDGYKIIVEALDKKSPRREPLEPYRMSLYATLPPKQDLDASSSIDIDSSNSNQNNETRSIENMEAPAGVQLLDLHTLLEDIDTTDDPPVSPNASVNNNNSSGISMNPTGNASIPVGSMTGTIDVDFDTDADTDTVERETTAPEECTLLEHWSTDYALGSDQVVTIQACAPLEFSTLRSFFGLRDRDYQHELLESGPFRTFHSNSKGAARTGGCFFLTNDGTYLIKTIKKDEMRTLVSILPRYMRYMKDNGRISLLNRFCGLYQIKLGSKHKKDEQPQHQHKEHYLVVMNSVFPGDAQLVERFDLKGSTVGREATLEEKMSLGNKAILKDLDLMHECASSNPELAVNTSDPPSETEMAITTQSELPIPGYGFHIGSTARASFLSQLRLDVEFLRDCGVIDYSLLVGVAAGNAGNRRPIWGQRVARAVQSVLQPRRKQTGLQYSSSLADDATIDAGPLSMVSGTRKGDAATFYFGLIDFLQPFDYKKELEYRIKGLVYEKDTYSCVPPEQYASRFLSFVSKYIT